MLLSSTRACTHERRRLAVTFQTCAVGAAGHEHPFHKPFFNSALACTANFILFAAVTAGRCAAGAWATATHAQPGRPASPNSPASGLSSFLDHSVRANVAMARS